MILFANHVVLTEGDSDPIYLYSIIQKAVAAGKASLDINALAVMSTSDSKHADALLRLLSETQPKPRISLIADGDGGGRERIRLIETLAKHYEVPLKQLLKDTTVEDHLPCIRELFVPAVASYVAKVGTTLETITKPDDASFKDRFIKHFDLRFSEGKVTQNIWAWVEEAAKETGKLPSAPSKVGIAREYAALLFDMPNDKFRLDNRPKGLIEWIQENAGVPTIHPAEKKILESE